MRLALITDQPRSPGVTTQYIDRVIQAVSASAGVEVEYEILPAITETVPGGKVPPAKQLRDGQPDLYQRVLAFSPDAVVPMGAAAMTGTLPVKPAPKIKTEHGTMRWVDFGGTEIVTTVSVAPIHVIRNSDLHRDFINVIYKAVTQTEPIPKMDIQVYIPNTVGGLESQLQMLDGASVIGVDVETGGLNPTTDALLALGLGAIYEDHSGGIAIVVTPDLMSDARALDLVWDAVWRSSRRSVGHNFKFDMQFMERLIGWAPQGASIGDTMLLSHLLDERPTRMNSRARGMGLKDAVAQRYDYQYGYDFKEFYELTEGTEEYATAISEMYTYLGDDVCYTARLWADLESEADDESPDLLKCHDDHVMPVSKALAKAEYAGAPLDVPWTRRTVEILSRRIDRRRAALECQLKKINPATGVDNILSPTQIADLMYDDWAMKPDIRKAGRLIKGDRSTDKEHITAAIARYRRRDSEQWQQAGWLQSLERLRKDVKQLTTFEGSLLDRVDSQGRIHASFLMHGTATGRLSSRQPNLQNIPAVNRVGSEQHRPMRRAFAPGEGRTWVEVDYSQLELRVAAALSGDSAFTEVFTSGRDVHLEIASGIFNKPPEDISKAERFLAKAVSFGILYGRSAKALAGGTEMEYAKRELGMTPWTEPQAKAFIRSFLRTYPELDAWITQTHADVFTDGYVATPFGRRRRFPLTPSSRGEKGSIERQAVNTPIQSAASDLCLAAMVEIAEEIEAQGMDATVLFPVHDSICIEVAEGRLDALEDLCRSVMEKDFMGVPMRVDFESAANWADIK